MNRRLASSRPGPSGKRFSLTQMAAIVLALFAAGLVFKTDILVAVKPGDTVVAEFAQNYGLVPTKTKVKVAGLEAGVVTDVETTAKGTALATMKVDEDAVELLGSDPEAEIHPLTVLGGSYAIQLVPGGDGAYDGDTIPLARTQIPVELDRILEALPTDTRASLQGVVRKGEASLKEGADELGSLIDDAPPIIGDAGTVFRAAHGRRGGDDLRKLVANIHDLAHVLSSEDLRWPVLAEDLRRTTTAVARQSGSIEQMIADLPSTLEATDRGMVGVEGTLDRLTADADDIRPSIAQLDPLLAELEPVLKDTLPLMRDLGPLLRDADPLVRDLVPTTTRTNGILRDLKGPVLDRVNGPIMTTLTNTWHGSGEYKNSGGGVQADNKMYEEIGYMVTNLNRASMTQDAQGSLLNFQAGVGLGTLAPLSLDQALAELAQQIAGEPQ